MYYVNKILAKTKKLLTFEYFDSIIDKSKNGMWPSLVGHYVRDTVLSNSLVLSRTPTNLLTPPLYGDLKNKIHVVKSVLTTCYPTDTGI